MRPCLIEATTIGDAYFTLLSNLWRDGIKTPVDTGSHAGSNRLEFMFAAGVIQYPHVRPLAPIFPEGVPPVTTDEAISEYFANYLMDPNLNRNEEYRYSQWINGHMDNWAKRGFIRKPSSLSYSITSVEIFWESQLEWCIRHFKEKGFGNNHCYIKVGNPESCFNYDIHFTNETERRTTPCLQGIDLKIKDNQLILGVVFRSWDLYGAFGENIGGMTLLNEYIAEELGISPGPITFASQGLHCYDHQILPLKAILHIED